MTKTPELAFFPVRPAGRPSYCERIRGAFADHLAKNGLRLTRQRRKILERLVFADRHLGSDDIHRALRKEGIGRVTVFRTLKMLEAARLVDHVAAAGRAPRFEVKFERPHHDHLVCIQCGAIREVRWPEIERVQEKTCRANGFSIAWHRHEVFGLCRRCSRKGAGRR